MRLNDVLPWGRDLIEYKAMFLLNDTNIDATILGCADGPSSFNAQMHENGKKVTSIDPIYAFSVKEIKKRVEETADIVISQVEKETSKYVWKSIPDPKTLKCIRLDAMRLFLDDLEKGKKEKRYVNASLPDLPFQELEFDLALCSHFLFLYSDHLDYDFHVNAVFEMLRVANEVRIFPLVTLEGTFSPFVEPLIDELEEEGFMCSIKTTHYEFQKGANQMLVIN